MRKVVPGSYVVGRDELVALYAAPTPLGNDPLDGESARPVGRLLHGDVAVIVCLRPGQVDDDACLLTSRGSVGWCFAGQLTVELTP